MQSSDGFNRSMYGLPIRGHTLCYKQDGSGRDSYIKLTNGGFSNYKIPSPTQPGKTFTLRFLPQHIPSKPFTESDQTPALHSLQTRWHWQGLIRGQHFRWLPQHDAQVH